MEPHPNAGHIKAPSRAIEFFGAYIDKTVTDPTKGSERL